MAEDAHNQSNTENTRGRFPRRIVMASGLLLLGTLATCLRFGPRDGVQLLAPIFYGTPQPLIVAAFVLAWLLLFRRRTRMNRLVGVVAVLQCLIWAADWNRPATDSKSEGQLKLGFWNVASCSLGPEGVVEEVQSWDADLIGLAESSIDDQPKFWTNRMSTYSVVRFPRGMRLLSRHRARKIAAGKLGVRSNYGVAEVNIGDEILYVVMADIISTPTAPRGPIFRALREVLSDLLPRPIILMGDLNTPTQSVHFDEIRTTFRNAFEERGTGFYYSWPMICPVLSLDHLWANDRVHFRSCDLQWTRRSDHRPLLTTFDFVHDQNESN